MIQIWSTYTSADKYELFWVHVVVTSVAYYLYNEVRTGSLATLAATVRISALRRSHCVSVLSTSMYAHYCGIHINIAVAQW